MAEKYWKYFAAENKKYPLNIKVLTESALLKSTPCPGAKNLYEDLSNPARNKIGADIKKINITELYDHMSNNRIECSAPGRSRPYLIPIKLRGCVIHELQFDALYTLVEGYHPTTKKIGHLELESSS